MGVFPEKRPDGKFRKRLRRRLYYGDMADLDVPSLPLTELAVDYFHDSAPGKLGHVDLESAASIVRENKVTTCSMVTSVVYAKRLRQRSKLYLESMSSSDIFFISMMMASKYMYDEGTDDEVYNDEWAVSIGQEVSDVNKMEVDFLEALDWRLFVRPDEFELALGAIEKRLALKEGLKRGWFTYSELDVLMGPDLIGSLWSGVGAECSRLVASLSAAYVTGLLGMLGSVVLASQVAAPLSSATTGALLALRSSAVSSPLGASPLFMGRPSLCEDASHGCQVVPGELSAAEDVNETFPGGWRSTDTYGPADAQVRIEQAGSSQDASFEYTSMEDKEGQKREAVSQVEGKNQQVTGKDLTKRCGNKGRGEEAVRCPRPATSSSSLWSLWFLDSLLSQIWALSGRKTSSSEGPQSCTSVGDEAGAMGNYPENSSTSNVELPSLIATDLSLPGVSGSDSCGRCRSNRGPVRGRRGRESLSPSWRSDSIQIQTHSGTPHGHKHLHPPSGPLGLLPSLLARLVCGAGCAASEERCQGFRGPRVCSPGSCRSCSACEDEGAGCGSVWPARVVCGPPAQRSGQACGQCIGQNSGGGGGSGQVCPSQDVQDGGGTGDFVGVLSGLSSGISRTLQGA